MLAILDNWHAHERGEEWETTCEIPFLTDASIIGQPDAPIGPHLFINTIADRSGQSVLQHAIVGRIQIYHAEEVNFDKLEKTDDSAYHGGDIFDEISSLLSLCLGIRIKTSNISREFVRGGDPLGTPRAYSSKNLPHLTANSHSNPVVPNACGSRNITKLDPFPKFVQLSDRDAVALVKAARLYQEAIWISDADPSMSWLLMVSAVETAANNWNTTLTDPVDALTASMPRLVDELKKVGDIDHVQRVSEELVRITGATRKFIDFMTKFLPEPPEKRPNENLQLSYRESDMKKSLRQIYAYRSEALHSGKPFPLPMCLSPARPSAAEIQFEIPSGLAMYALGASWKIEDTPMHLNTFEYLARNAILNWWRSMCK